MSTLSDEESFGQANAPVQLEPQDMSVSLGYKLQI